MSKSSINPRIAFAIAIIGGLIIGKLIKRMSVGLVIGIFLSLMYAMSVASKSRSNDE